MKENQAKISVVTTLYNAEKYLKEYFDSILSQSYDNIEVNAVINGFSSDNTEEIVLSYAKHDDRVKPIQNKMENNTIIDGFKAGLRNVKGEYFTFIDGDDMLMPNALDSLYNKIVEDKSDIAIGNIRKMSMDGQLLQRIGMPDFSVLDRDDYFPLSFWFMDFLVHGKLYSATLLKENEIKYLPVTMGADFLLHYQFVFHAKKISRCKEDVHCYRMNLNSASHNISIETGEHSFRCYLLLDDLFNNNNVYKDLDTKYAFKSQGLLRVARCLLQDSRGFYQRYGDEIDALLKGDEFKQNKVRQYLKGWPYYYYILMIYNNNMLLGDLLCFVLNKVRMSKSRRLYEKITRSDK